ncbi:uncharacterized protein VDAG_09700 [Verticillium dahliae VdLs.17]|uniref:Uncharacterized protein n=1 Tax=Verticillium dahliae (strain VdLs.17 / ATCC MYA-4575 / FGSC 10137) TaxID=498257 RepID=G2XI50_VERDV|nr:uncharacterized protein VDAG_09700 [Verticillium dahliae VdLs.17]EGY19498.1 hypothetical protein VDAG_09700 [Verticillium dahliae VdLs.17]
MSPPHLKSGHRIYITGDTLCLDELKATPR